MNKEAILLVDDEKNVLDGLVRLFHGEDFLFFTAQSGESALDVLRDNKVAVVVSDYHMPLMNGIEFLLIVKERYPETVRVLLTGQSDMNVAIEAINKGEIYRYLSKPVQKEELLITFNQSLENYRLRRENRELTEKTMIQNEELIRLNQRLEELNKAQTKTIELSQEILERLPVAVIGITANQEIALTNDMAKRLIPSLRLITPGTDIAEILPGEILNAVESCMNDGSSMDSVRFIWNRTVIRAMIEPIRENGKSKGCIIAFESQEIG